MKKTLKDINKKTDWIYLYYFEFIHAFGLFIGSLLFSTLITKWLILELENYKLLFFLLMYIPLIITSNLLTSDKRFKKSITSTAIGLGLIWILFGYII